LRHRSGLVCRDLLDLHAALHRAHRQEGAVGPVQQEGQVVLLRDVDRLGDSTVCTTWPLMSMPRIWPALFVGLVRALGQLHAAGLAAAAHLHLRLHHDQGWPAAANSAAISRASSAVWATLPRWDRDAVLGEQFLRLILKQVHA
jgi:hypothetical protein